MLDPSILVTLEDNIRVIQEDEYARLSQNVWWQKITKELPSASRKEFVEWIMTTAQIKRSGYGGNMVFQELAAQTTMFQNENAGVGIKLDINQFEDLDGKGFDQASKWSRDAAAYAAYWPQLLVAQQMLYGETGLAYDGKAFFANNHPVNPADAENAVTFANIFTGGASGSYPGACPIDDSVTLDVAFVNLAKIIAYIRQIKMPNGQDSRFLRATSLFVPSRMVMRAQQLTGAKFIAQAAASGAGSADVSMLATAWGMAAPQEVVEFGAAQSYTLENGATVTGSDTTFYIACEEVATSQLGALVYVNREPFSTRFYGELTIAELGRMNQLEYQMKGRNTAGYGHPYLLFKCKAS